MSDTIVVTTASDKQINYIKYLLHTYEKIPESDKESQNNKYLCSYFDTTKYSEVTLNTLTKEMAYDLIQYLKNKFNLIDTRSTTQWTTNSIVIAKSNYYEIGWQLHENKQNICYFSFHNLLIVDWDEMTMEDIESILATYATHLTFAIYKTFKGYHGYCVSEPFNLDYKTMKFMKCIKCDPIYIQYCIQNGFVVRLNKKENRFKEEHFVEKFVKYIGDEPINPSLHILLKLKDECLENDDECLENDDECLENDHEF